MMQDPTQYLATFSRQRFIISQDAIKTLARKRIGEKWIIKFCLFRHFRVGSRVREKERDVEAVGGVNGGKDVGVFVVVILIFCYCDIFVVWL